MATAKKTPQPQFPQAQFVSYTLSDDQRKELKKTIFSAEEYDSQMLKLEEEDYKITFRPDTFNKCHAVWIIPTGEKHVNAGMILSGRGSTPLKALKQALYIHYQIFDGEWGAWRDTSKGEDIDD